MSRGAGGCVLATSLRRSDHDSPPFCIRVRVVGRTQKLGAHIVPLQDFSESPSY
jgi:hypothetical protein